MSYPAYPAPSYYGAFPAVSYSTLPTTQPFPSALPFGYPAGTTSFPAAYTSAYPSFYPSMGIPTTTLPSAPIEVEKPKLTYFNGRGRAEVIRLIFAVAGVDYEDYRFKPNADIDVNPTRLNDEFLEFKKSGVSPTGQVPFLEIRGYKLAQSMAICRLLAGWYNLNGNATDKSRVEIDIVVDTVLDLVEHFYKPFHEKDETKKAELTKTFWETICPKYGEILEKLLARNELNSGYFVDDRLTLADLVFYDCWSTLMAKDAEVTKPFEKLSAHCTRIGSLPRIAEWIAKRPETHF